MDTKCDTNIMVAVAVAAVVVAAAAVAAAVVENTTTTKLQRQHKTTKTAPTLLFLTHPCAYCCILAC